MCACLHVFAYVCDTCMCKLYIYMYICFYHRSMHVRNSGADTVILKRGGGSDMNK